MAQPKPKVGDYVDAGNDEGEVLEVRGEWVFFWSEECKRVAMRHVGTLSVSPTPDQIAEMAAEIRASHGGQPRECVNRGPRPCNVIDGKVGRRRNKHLMD